MLLCLTLSPSLVYLRVLPCVPTHLLAKTDSSEEAHGWVDTTYYGVAPLPFWTHGEPLCAPVVGCPQPPG